MSLAIRAARLDAQAGDAGYGRIGSMDREIYGGISPGVQGVLGARAVGDPGLPIFAGLIAKLGGKLIGGIARKLGIGGRRALPLPPLRLPTTIPYGRVARGLGGAAAAGTAFGAGQQIFDRRGTAVATISPEITGGGLPSGYKLNKTGYFVERDKGNPAAGGEWVAPGTRVVRKRRPNAANSRKTNRAIAQVTRAKNMAKDLNRITIRKKSCK